MATFEIDSKMLKGPGGIAVAVVVLLLAGGYMHWRRASLIEQGTAEAQKYLELELPSAYSRQMLKDDPSSIDPARLEALGKVEIVSFSPSWFFRADRDKRVRVKVVSTAAGETFTHHFRFKSVLGQWRLDAETAPPLFDALR